MRAMLSPVRNGSCRLTRRAQDTLAPNQAEAGAAIDPNKPGNIADIAEALKAKPKRKAKAAAQEDDDSDRDPDDLVSGEVLHYRRDAARGVLSSAALIDLYGIVEQGADDAAAAELLADP